MPRLFSPVFIGFGYAVLWLNIVMATLNFALWAIRSDWLNFAAMLMGTAAASFLFDTLAAMKRINEDTQ